MFLLRQTSQERKHRQPQQPQDQATFYAEFAIDQYTCSRKKAERVRLHKVH